LHVAWILLLDQEPDNWLENPRWLGCRTTKCELHNSKTLLRC
jgi:hypothetical protein